MYVTLPNARANDQPSANAEKLNKIILNRYFSLSDLLLHSKNNNNDQVWYQN